jgi:hypothetical protein
MFIPDRSEARQPHQRCSRRANGQTLAPELCKLWRYRIDEAIGQRARTIAAEGITITNGFQTLDHICVLGWALS